jgi:hypothetical protein
MILSSSAAHFILRLLFFLWVFFIFRILPDIAQTVTMFTTFLNTFIVRLIMDGGT